jgi:hypothetical protein
VGTPRWRRNASFCFMQAPACARPLPSDCIWTSLPLFEETPALLAPVQQADSKLDQFHAV